MSLPVVDPFNEPYDAWEARRATYDEMMEIHQRTGELQTHINVRLIARVTTGLEAATFMGEVGADGGIDFHINAALDNDPNFNAWRRAMPRATPQALKDYKVNYPDYNAVQVDHEINTHGALLSPGQVLYHAGLWPDGNSLVTTRPLSTSLCPQVALRNAEHRGKAYDAGRIDLFALRVTKPMTRAFVYKRKGVKLKNENEVLLASGAVLTLVSQTPGRADHLVGKSISFGIAKKRIPVYVLEVELN